MFDGFWESFAPAFTVSFGVCFGIVLVIRIWQWTNYLIGNRVVEAVEDRNDEMAGESKP